MDTFSITRTSGRTAECQPITLRETDQRRLVFKAVLLNNPNDPKACIDGTFVFQRKRKAEDWEDHSELKLTHLKASEWVKLKLSADEVHAFLRHMAALYRHHQRHGLPSGKIHLLKLDLADDNAEEVANRFDFERIVALSQRAGVDVLSQFLEWVASVGDSKVVVDRIQRLDISSLDRLGVLTRLASLKNVLSEWEGRLEEGGEDYWQAALEEHAFVLAQLVAVPILIIKGKAFVGGKGIEYHGGHLADYLAKNPVTQNAVIVELKTPTTPLLESHEYRTGVYAPSRELAGAISQQVLTYRDSLVKEYDGLVGRSQSRFHAFRPKCLVIIGNATSAN